MKFCWNRFSIGVALSAAFFLTQSATAQVVAIDSTVNVDGLYSNWSTDGKASVTSPVASSYNNYRKGGSGTDPTAADNGNGVLGTWSNINHAPTITPCCGNPGMFFGNSPSTKSYSDAILNIGTNSEAGNAMDGDSGSRRRFDMRFGFVESPADYVAAFGGAGSGHYDLWTGNWGTDGIQFNVQIGNTDDAANTLVRDTTNGGNRISATNRFVNVPAAMRGQSGVDSGIADERNRDRWISTTNFNGLAGPLTAVDLAQTGLTLDVPGTTGNGARFDTGVALDGNVEIEWGMELNDPTNANAALARQVKFNFRAGNVQYTQVFDPGDAANPVAPNSSTGVNYKDGFFDWQNAYPVFFVGPSGGAGVDTNAALTMGFSAPATGLACDLSGDGQCDLTDIELLIDDVVAGNKPSSEIATWLADASAPNNPYLGGTKTFVIGDANLDGSVDSADLGLLLNNFGSTTILDWNQGNMDGNSVVDSGDLGQLLNNFGATSAAAAAVPEPTGLSMLLVAMLGLMGLSRRRR